jgi:D-amino peptidase
MKVFISADMEGCAGVTSWNETELGNSEHLAASEQLTLEVKVVCETLLKQGAKEIVVKDAHDSGRNIFHDQLPKGVKIIRQWLNSPYEMVQGLDESFDAAIFVGYHSGASMTGNPLSHTMSMKNNRIIINDMIGSEYLIHAFAAADFNVPVILLTGDKMICEWAESFNPAITTAAVKEGIGGGIISLNRQDALELIAQKTVKSLNQIKASHLKIPDTFKVSIVYKSHIDAMKAAYYPGVTQIDTHKVSYSVNSIKDMLTTNMFIL